MTPAPAGPSRLGWGLLLAHTLLVHGVTQVLRPTTSYRALELGLAPSLLGVLSASFALVPLFLALAVGRAADRHGERLPLLGGAALVLVSAVGFATLADSLPALAAWSAVLGLGHLLTMVGQQSLVATLAGPGRSDVAFGRYAFAASAGQALGPGTIAALSGAAALPDTGRLFVAGAAGSLLLLGATFLLPAGRARRAAGVAERPRVVGVLTLPGLGPAVLASLTVIAAIDLLVVYLPALGAERGISASAVGVLLALRAGASMVSRLGLGRLVAAVGRLRLLAASLVTSGLAVALIPVSMPLALLGAVVVLAGLALGIGQPLTMSWVAQAAPEHLRATALSLRLTGNRLGQVALPSAVGLVAAASGAGGVLWATAVALAAVGVVTGHSGRRGQASPGGPPASS